MIKKIYTETKVPCPYRLENGSTVDRCKECSFFNGVQEDENNNIIGVDCLRSEIGAIHAHVTQFTKGEYIYTARMYDEDKDGKLSEPYNYCEKCCFNKILQNGNDICMLRCGISDDSNIESFCCYEGEIWEKEKISDY